MIDHYTQVSYYSQLLPCRHLAIIDTPLMRTAAKSLLKITDTWQKKTPAIMDLQKGLSKMWKGQRMETADSGK